MPNTTTPTNYITLAFRPDGDTLVTIDTLAFRPDGDTLVTIDRTGWIIDTPTLRAAAAAYDLDAATDAMWSVTYGEDVTYLDTRDPDLTDSAIDAGLDILDAVLTIVVCKAW